MGGKMGYGYLARRISWLVERGRYSDSLHAGRSGDQIPVGARYSIPGSHLVSYNGCQLCFQGAWR
jgi:hypothetical protein